MRASYIFLISIFVILLIALNILIIPQQRKAQLELDKNALWEMSVSKDHDMILTPYNLIELIDTEPVFQLKSIDKTTGKAMNIKRFAGEIGAAYKVVCIEDAIYVLFAASYVYKLDANTLETLWKTSLKPYGYSWEEIKIEQAKNLILFSYTGYSDNGYIFIQEETGAIYHDQKKYNDATYSIVDIFASKEESQWGRYYNFKNNKFVFDTINKEVIYIDAYLMNINDPLKLTSFEYGYRSSMKTYERNNIESPFEVQVKSFQLEQGILLAGRKEITSIQYAPQTILFRFEQVSNKYHNEVEVADYQLLSIDQTQSNLSLHNISKTLIPFISDDRFVATLANINNQYQTHEEIVVINLNDFSLQQSFYAPSKHLIKKLLCDKERLYVLIRKEAKISWVAVPLNRI